MYSVRLDISDESDESSPEFLAAAHGFLEDIAEIPELTMHTTKTQPPGSRGELALLTNIVVSATSIATLTALYTLAKDMFALYANAEVTLRFDDGSTISLKHLTHSEALTLLQQHLAKAAK